MKLLVDKGARLLTILRELHWLYWFVVILALMVTLLVSYFLHQQSEERIQQALDREAFKTVSVVVDRMKRYEDALSSAAAYIQSVNNHFGQQDWAFYVNALDLQQRFPGMNGVGVIYKINSQDKTAFELRERKIFPMFKIHPLHDKKELWPITYAEPLALNREILGLDIAFEADCYIAAKMAEVTGKSEMTAPITLVQDSSKTPGFLLFVPLYDWDNAGGKKFVGLVYAPFVMKAFIRSIFLENYHDIRLRISDRNTILYQETSEDTLNNSHYKKEIQLSIYGRVWTFKINATSAFVAMYQSHGALYVLLSGILLDLMLLLIFIILSQQNLRVKVIAEKLTKDLRDKTKELDKVAYFDSLTKLPNRVNFMHQLEVLYKKSSGKRDQFGICFLNIKKFKQFNDVLGYQNADELLIHVAQKLQKTFSKSLVARYGSDEFAMLFNLHGHQSLENFINKIKTLFLSPIEFNEQKILINVAAGIALSVTKDTEKHDLLVSAGLALRKARLLEGTAVEVFDASVRKEIDRHYIMTIEIRKALSLNELFLVYQPQLSIKTGKVAGVEVLLRWKNSIFGDVSPAEFIPLLERMGMMQVLGAWVQKNAMLAFAQLYQQVSKDIVFSFNVSATEIADDSFVDMLKSHIKQSQLPVNTLCMEITETAFVGNIEMIKSRFDEVRAIGVQVAIDDFGAGYGSMFYLQNLVVDYLKIDKSFIQGVAQSHKARLLVRSMIELAHDLKIKVIAEGVETEEIMQYLVSLDCEMVQGFYFAKPMVYEDLVNYIVDRNSGGL